MHVSTEDRTRVQNGLDRAYPFGRRGFAGMTAERRREIAASGGRAAQQSGNAHRWTPEEARALGARDGATPKRKRKTR